MKSPVILSPSSPPNFVRTRDESSFFVCHISNPSWDTVKHIATKGTVAPKLSRADSIYPISPLPQQLPQQPDLPIPLFSHDLDVYCASQNSDHNEGDWMHSEMVGCAENYLDCTVKEMAISNDPILSTVSNTYIDRISNTMKRIISYSPIFQTHTSPLVIANKCNEAALLAHVEEVFQLFDNDYKVSLAKATTGPFDIPQDLIDEDVALYRSLGSIEAVAQYYQDKTRHAYLNQDSVERWVDNEDPDYPRIIEIASTGFTIDAPTGFVQNHFAQEPLRRRHKELASTMNKLTTKNREKEHCILLPAQLLSPEDIARGHAAAAGWAMKWDSPEGRQTVDESFSSVGMSLNDGDAKDLAITRYGAIELPTICDIVTDWYAYAESKNTDIAHCASFKDDINHAFPQNHIKPSSVYLLAIYILEGLLCIFIRGCFGWTGNPMVWGVVSRVMQRFLSKVISGTIHIFVDDIMCLSLIENADSDQQKLHASCCT